MSEIIVHHKGLYNIYNTVSDGFHYLEPITRQQLEAAIQKDYGAKGLDQLPARLGRAHKNGHSAIFGGTLREFLAANRAGIDETHLTYEECMRQFLGA